MKLHSPPNTLSNHVTLFIPGFLDPNHHYESRDLNVAPVSYAMWKSLRESGREAADVIQSLKKQFSEVYGIGHSVGGLILRAAIELYGSEITRYATVAMPNDGLHNWCAIVSAFGRYTPGFRGVCRDLTGSFIDELKESKRPIPFLNVYSPDDDRVQTVEITGEHAVNLPLIGLKHSKLLKYEGMSDILKKFLFEGTI